MKKDYNYIYIFLISILLIIILKGNHIYFGSQVDYMNQHVSFLDYFRDLFQSSKTIFPSFAFNIGMGQNIYNFSYYGLYNPLFIPFYLSKSISAIDYMQMVNIIVYISTALLSYKFLKNEVTSKYSFIATIFLMFATPLLFHIHRHYMFICYLPFLLVALISINNYFKNKKCLLLIIMNLFISLSSFYYSISCFLVEFIYFTYLYLKNNKFILKKYINESFKIILIFIISILLSVFYLFPTFMAIIGNREISSTTINIISLFIPNLSINNILYNNYSLGLSVISIASIVYYAIKGKIEKKFLGISILIILFIPLFVFLLNGTLYIRSKILIPFIPLIILLLASFLENTKNIKINNKLYIIILIIISFINLFVNIPYTIIFIIDSIITLIYLNRKKGIYIILLLIELLFINIYITQTETFITKTYYEQGSTNQIEKVINSDKNIYRIKTLKSPLRNVNNIVDSKHYITSLYSSVENKYYKDFLINDFKIERANKNKLMYTNSDNILFDSFFNNKYIINYDKVNKNNNTRSIIYATYNNTNINDYNKIKYPYNLEYLFNGSITEDKTNYSFNSIIKEEKLNENKYKFKLNKTITKKIKNNYKNKIVLLSFKINKDVNRYIKINDSKNMVTYNTLDYYYGNDNNVFHYVLYSNDDYYNIEISKGNYIIDDIKLYTIDYNDYLSLNNNIVNATVDYDKTYGDYIEAKINVDKAGYLNTTIPYDDNFKIYIDDKESKLIKINKAFIGTKVSSGNHKIKIIYKNKYLIIGKKISFITLILFILIYLYKIITLRKNS